MSFNDIIDQQAVVTILKEELESRRISHAYLFTGQEGIGKKTLAFEFAKALLCKQKQQDSCNECKDCKKIDHSNHPDVKFIKTEEDSNNIKIDQIRELQREIVYKPYETNWKVYIIDEADNMTLEAANSLLKTLEEPPDYAIIILLAEEMSQLLPTVISRCQEIRLKNISREMIKAYLVEHGIKENKAGLYSRMAKGSLGLALELTNDEEFLNYRREVLDFLVELPGANTVDIFNKIEEMEKILSSGFPFFNLISSWYRDIIINKKGNQNQVVNYDYLEDITKQVEKYDIKELLAIIKLINKYESYIERNVRKGLTLQVLLLKIRSKRV